MVFVDAKPKKAGLKAARIYFSSKKYSSEHFEYYHAYSIYPMFRTVDEINSTGFN